MLTFSPSQGNMTDHPVFPGQRDSEKLIETHLQNKNGEGPGVEVWIIQERGNTDRAYQ
jgi:hypothetical protein